MSIKKLFESTNKVQEFVSDSNNKELFNDDAESVENIEQKELLNKTYTPQIDYSDPANFVKYGSARLYYKSALTRIADYYPYDGSEMEINKFLNGSLDIEKYIFENVYPRSTGYIEIGTNYTITSLPTDGYGRPTTNEHIDFVGGPGTGSVTSTSSKDLMPNPENSKYSYANIYDEDIYQTAKLPSDYGKGTRTSNLRSNFDDGVTTEFWLKTGSLDTLVSRTTKQVVLDVWNQNAASSEDYGRLMVELTSAHGASGLGKPEQRPFVITAQSGIHTTKDFLSLGDFSLHSNMGDWNHYAIKVQNTGSFFKAQLYVNGYLNDTAIRMPYDLASTHTGLLATAYNATSASQERAWPHAIEEAYSSADSLQGWWRLNNSSSVLTRVDDMSGKGRTGDCSGVGDKPTIDTTNFPSAYIQGTTGSMKFDGAAGVSATNRVLIGDAPTWDAIIGNDTAGGSTEKMTFAAWIRPEGLGEFDLGRIIDFGVGDISLYMASGPDIIFQVTWSSGIKSYRIVDPISLNQWTHVAVTYDATSSTNLPVIYINGVSVSFTGAAPGLGTFSGITSTGGTPERCTIGNNSNAGKTFDGQIADVAVWNSILSANEIRSIYSAYTIKSTTHVVNQINSKNIAGRIGALQTADAGGAGIASAGKLSGSLDEFRFWKVARTPKQIGTNWFTQVRGGTNRDLANTTLGVYYKFNEGITGDTNTDSIVLDYAGRVTNGTWTGYGTYSRRPGSAIVSASAATKEFLDPIIRTNHPKYQSVENLLLTSGSSFDYQNNSALIRMMPGWILDENEQEQNYDLNYITHIMGVYFDKLYHQIKELPKLRNQTFTSGTMAPISFAEHLPQSLGLYSPEIFIDSTVLEKFMNRSDKIVFENDLYEAKNLIYQNLYNNLAEIYKAKGTEQAVRNVLKCFNINDNLLALKINSNNTEFNLKNNLEQQLLKKNSANFSIPENNKAVVYQKQLTFPPGPDSVEFLFTSDTKTAYGAGAGANYVKLYNGSTRYNIWFDDGDDSAPSVDGTEVEVDISDVSLTLATDYAATFKNAINGISGTPFAAVTDSRNPKKIIVKNASTEASVPASKVGTIAPLSVDSSFRGAVTGSTKQYGYGFTYESNVIFPNYELSQLVNNRFDADYNQVSLFGTVTVDGTSPDSVSGVSTTAVGASSDYGNFKVYFVRESRQSKNGSFKLVFSNPDDKQITLTSEVFKDVYDNGAWNLSVRVKPQDYSLATFVAPAGGSEDDGTPLGVQQQKYDVIFSGYNAITTDLFNSFKVTHVVDTGTGKKFIESAKRAYVGADRVNVTGDVSYLSDVLVSSVAYWTKCLEDTDLQQHSLDLENIGLSGSMQPLNALDKFDLSSDTDMIGTSPNIHVENMGHDTLALNWNFRNVTGSDNTGNFLVQDFSSGSALDREQFGWTGGISGYQYSGYGFGFAQSSTKVVKKQPINIYKFVDPERPVSSDMVQIFTDADDLTPNLRREEIVPNFVYSLEKSLYGAISKEILDFLAGVIDFNDVIGHPVNYYRDRYKTMEKIRHQFFRRVSEISTVEKYTEYYKWFDSAITDIVSQLIPASGEYINDIQNVVESHVLERNKYQNKLGILDPNKFNLDEALPDGTTIGIGISSDDVADSLVVKESSPRDTKINLPFWKKRADRRSIEITSGDVNVDNQRNIYRDIIYSVPVNSGSATPPTLRDIAGTGSSYNKTNFYLRTLNSVTHRLAADSENVSFGPSLNDKKVITKQVKGGVNFESAKNIEFAHSITKPAGPINSEGGVFVPLNVMVGFIGDSTEIPIYKKVGRPSEYIAKQKKIFKVQTGRDWEYGLGYKNVKSSMAFPFNVYSSSVEVSTGYNKEVVERVDRHLMITNLHNDVYGAQLEIPMQGPFTNYAVGGHQSRHIDLNVGTDQQNNRAEAWRIMLGTCDDIVPSGAIGVVGADYPPANLDLGCHPAGTRPYPYEFHEKAYFYRDFIAKRPVNIKNMLNVRNNKTIPGNYNKNYEVIHSFGATHNARAFIDNQPTLPSQLAQVNSTTNVRTLLDIHRGEQSHFVFVDDYDTSYLNHTGNQTIITNRFSAPGGIEVQTRGYQNFEASEFSPYNSQPYRNLTVIKPSQGPSGSISETHGGTPSTMKVQDIHDKDYGLTSHAARHSAKFGRDSLFVTNPGVSYSELPSFHKIQRNTRQIMKLVNDSFVTSSVFDNLNVTRPIPQSDRQYLWLSRSVIDLADIKYSGYQRTGLDEMNPFRTSSAGLEHYWTFVSSSEPATNSIAQSTNGLNLLIVDPITTATNTIGLPSDTDISNYMNAGFFANPAARKAASTNYLNQLLTSRGTTYGWGWNKFHQNDNKILVNERKQNKLTIATGSDSRLNTYDVRPVSLKGRSSYINFDARAASPGPSNNNTTIKVTHTNEKIFFNQYELNKYANVDMSLVSEPYKDVLNSVRGNLTTLNWFLYTQNIFPSLRNEFGAFSSKRVGYDNKFWRDSRTARAILGNTLSSSMVGAIVSKSSWPLDAPQNFLTRTSIAGTTGSAAIKFDSTAYLTRQPFVPFSSSTTQGVITGTSSLGFNFFVPAGGELQNTYSSYFTINTDGARYLMMQAGPLYARKHVLGSPKSVVSPSGIRIPETGSLTNIFTGSSHQLQPFAGEALWEAADQAGVVLKKNITTNKILDNASSSVFVASASNPWYDNYDDYKNDLRLIAKGYAIVPEYRMSEHVKDYFKFGFNNESKTDFFEIVGTNSSSADTDFYKDYSNTDFLENFLGIKRDSLLNAKEIKLTCNAAIKYNPYKGFYPAQRTIDLAEQFADSFKDSIGGAFSLSTGSMQSLPLNNKTNGVNNLLYERAAGVLKPLLDPLVSPGILYNSIKSGIAVDYPIVSNHRKRKRRPYGVSSLGGTQNYALSITGSATEEMYVSGTGEYLGGQYWDKRIPFEAIIEPRKYILNTNFIDMESHPSMSLDWNWNYSGLGADLVYEKEAFTGSFSDNADGVYSMMARNFFGACGEFFLESSGITRLESNTVLNDLQFDKDSNFGGSRPLYMARVKLRRSHNGARTYDKEFDSYGQSGTASYYGVNGAKRTINGSQSAGQYALPQDPMHNPLFKETFTMYSRPTAFGPPCAGRPDGTSSAAMPFLSASKDSFSGYNPAFTPPYYDGEAWADLIFRPHVLNRDVNPNATAEKYDLNRILNETKVVCWRFDPGEERQVGDPTKTGSMPVLIPVEQTQLRNFLDITPDNDKTVPSIYDGKRINANSMQLTASVKVFGTEKVLQQETDKFGNIIKNSNKPVGSKWIIQPKWETPMLNFNDEGVHPISAEANTLTLPTYGSASVPRGMWHQFGVIPDDPNKGIFLEITDIPEDWLRSHYKVLSNESSPYNEGSTSGASTNAATVKERNKERANLYKHIRSLSSLCGFDQTNSSTKLGQIKESFAVHEAIVAVPYVLEQINQLDKSNIPKDSKLRQTRKKFISIPKRRFAATREEESGTAQADSLSSAGQSIRRLKQNMEKYVFPPEFDFLNNKEVDPIAMYVFEFKYEFDRDDLSYIWQNLAPRDSEEVHFKSSSVVHNLADNELINEEILMSENLRWMVFKVKQRCQTDYFDLIADQANESTRQVEQKNTKLSEYKFGFNWPYDYLSFVELIKMDVDILFK